MTAEQKEQLKAATEGLISPIEFVRIVAPDKPPQYAYQLLKQGLPHVEIQVDKGDKGGVKRKPMIQLDIAKQWFEDAIATKAPRTRNSSSSQEGSGSDSGSQGTTGQVQGKQGGTPGDEAKPYKNGQLLTYQRRPGLSTVAQVRSSDVDMVYYTTVHGDQINDGADMQYTYPFQPQSLRKKILERKIILDNPRRILGYVIDSLNTLPVQEDDQDLAEELRKLVIKYPAIQKQVMITPISSLLPEIDSDDDEEVGSIPTSDSGDDDPGENNEGADTPEEE